MLFQVLSLNPVTQSLRCNTKTLGWCWGLNWKLLHHHMQWERQRTLFFFLIWYVSTMKVHVLLSFSFSVFQLKQLLWGFGTHTLTTHLPRVHGGNIMNRLIPHNTSVGRERENTLSLQTHRSTCKLIRSRGEYLCNQEVLDVKTAD